MKRINSTTLLIAWAALAFAAVVWAYWTTLSAMAAKWWHDPQYSQGYLVPIVCLIVLLARRNFLRRPATHFPPLGRGGTRGGGFALILLGLGLHLLCSRLNFDWLDGVSLLPVAAGLFLLAGGRTMLRWAWPSVLLLLFMVPLPFVVETSLTNPLLRIATRGSAYVLQTCGLPAVAEGNVIFLTQARIGVVEACSGLSMLLIVFAMTTVIVIVYRPPLLESIILIVSAIPIAVLVNILRITATGIAQELWGTQAAETIFHDWAGWLMMPAACGLLLLLIWLMRLLTSPVRTPLSAPGGGGKWGAVPPRSGGGSTGETTSAPSLPWATSAVLLTGALLTILGAGWWHGTLTDRWGDSTELADALSRLTRVKERIGQWESRPFEIDARQLHTAEILGYISRQYVHRTTGDQIEVLLICGRPGPISVHTPDVCYQGAGYTMGQRYPQLFRGMLDNQTPEFWSARFTKEPEPRPLHILWSWYESGRWQAPEHPRLEFYRAKALYKLYIIRAVHSLDAPLVDEPTRAFLSEFLIELQQAIGPATTPQPAP